MKSHYKKDFRDSLSTVSAEGKRLWVYPKKPKGVFHNWRIIISGLLLAFLFSAPFIRVNEQPLILLNIIERKFIFFGVIFWPQDFFLVVIGFLVVIIFIALFTVVFGRIFCGWVCPQTIFMEMVFRKIEYWIEGDYMKQKALIKAPWNWNKIWKKSSKHSIFFAIAFLIANTFLAYFISVDKLFKMVEEGPFAHSAILSSLIVFSGAFYFIFAWFREQVCTIACPYGRLQGVLLDKKSVVVAYDHKRGEPRGKWRKKVERTEGDCIDCYQCVHVCPTGIDIRNGTQLECVNCTACIDACDHIMDKIGKPHGLIRYASEENIEQRNKFTWSPRIIAYSAVLVLLAGLLSSLLVLRTDIDATIRRTPGQLYKVTDKGSISNLYNITIINKTFEEKNISIKLLYPNGNIRLVGVDSTIAGQGILKTVFFIDIPKEELKGKINSKVRVGIFSKGELLVSEKTKFFAPISTK